MNRYRRYAERIVPREAGREEALSAIADELPLSRVAPRQLIVVGGQYSGAGASFTSVALAKVLSALGVETAVVEFPKNEPYFYHHLDGATHLPRDYAYLFPQVMRGADIKNRGSEWKDGYITWYPADPSTGVLEDWTNELMSRCLYSIKSNVTILDISASWDDPALQDALKSADHHLLVAGPEPARLLSRKSKEVRKFIKNELPGNVKVIANLVPDVALAKSREWISSLPQPVISRLPGLPIAEMINATWLSRTVFDGNAQLISKFTDCFFPLIRDIIPNGFRPGKEAKQSQKRWWGRS